MTEIALLAATESSRWVEQLGRMHMAIVHFPIALLLVAGAIELLRALVRKQKPSSAAIVCLSIGAVSAALASAAGWVHRWDPLESTCRHASLSIL